MSSRQQKNGKNRHVKNPFAERPTRSAKEKTGRTEGQYVKINLDQNASEPLNQAMTADSSKNRGQGPYMAFSESQITAVTSKPSVKSHHSNPFGHPPTGVDGDNTGNADGPYLAIGTGEENTDVTQPNGADADNTEEGPYLAVSIGPKTDDPYQHSVNSNHINPFGSPPTASASKNSGKTEGPYLAISSGQQPVDSVKSNPDNPFRDTSTGAGKSDGPYVVISNGLMDAEMNETPSDDAHLDNAAEPEYQNGGVQDKSSMELNGDASDQALNISVTDYARECMIYIKNLPYTLTREDLYYIFSNFGGIVFCDVAQDGNGRSRGFGFVQYNSPEAARNAIWRGNKMVIRNRVLRVHRFLPPSEREVHPGPLTNFFKLFVRNFGAEYDDMHLQKLFEPYGNVVSCRIIRDKMGVSRKFGFVCFDAAQSAFSAIIGLNNKQVAPNCSLQVCRARDKIAYRSRWSAYSMEEQSGQPQFNAVEEENAQPQFNAMEEQNGQLQNNEWEEEVFNPNTMEQNDSMMPSDD